MKLILVFCVLFIQYVLGKHEAYEGFRGYKLTATTKEQLKKLQKYDDLTMDFWRRPSLEKSGVIIVPSESEDKFKAMLDESGVVSEEIISNVAEFLRAEEVKLSKTNNLQRFSFDAYHRFDEINSFLDSLAQNYSSYVTVNQIGLTAEGRALRYIQISTSGFSDSQKPLVVIEAGIHGREWISPATSLYIARSILDNPDHRPILEDVDWIVVPILNPDGYEFSHSSYRLWSKTRSLTSHLGILCPGVNIDRNFDIHWGVEDTSTSPCSHIYGGPEAFSDPEAQFLRDLIGPLASRITLYVSIQNGGGYVTYPWRYTDVTVTNSADLASLASIVASSEGLQGYVAGNEADVFGFFASGTSTDYVKAIGVNNVLTIDVDNNIESGFTIEADQIEIVSANILKGIEVGLRSLVELSESSGSKTMLSVVSFAVAVFVYLFA